MIRKILTLFVILNIVFSQFYPVLIYAQGSGIPDYCKAEDFNGTPETAPECFPVEFEVPKPSISTDYTDIPESDPLLSQTPGILQGWDSINIGVNVKPVVDEETQKRVVEKYDEDTRKWLKKDAEEAAAPREDEEKKSRDYTLANRILEQGGSIGEVNPGDQVGRLWNGFTSAIAGIGAGIKNAVFPDEETRRAQQAAQEAKKEFEAEFGGERTQKADRRLADLAAALASVNAEEKARIIQALGLGGDATDADLYVKFNENKGLAIQGDPGSGSFVITTQYGGSSVRILYESPGYYEWNKKETLQRIEKTGEIVADLGTMGLYSAIKRFPELKNEVLPKVVEACSSTVDTNSNGFRILVGEYQGSQSGKICDPNLPDITSCTPGFTNAEKEEAKAAAAQIKTNQNCHDAFTDYAELMADAYAGVTGAALNFVDPILVAGATIKVINVTTRGADAALRLSKGTAKFARGSEAVAKQGERVVQEAAEKTVQKEAAGAAEEKLVKEASQGLARTAQDKELIEGLATNFLLDKDPSEVSSELIGRFLRGMQYPEDEILQAVERVKLAYLRKRPLQDLEKAQAEKTAGVRRFDPTTDVSEVIAPGAGENAGKKVEQAIQEGKSAEQAVASAVEGEVKEAAGSLAGLGVDRAARDAGERAAALAEKTGEEEAARQAAREVAEEEIARVGGQELVVPNNPVSKVAAWVQDRFDGLFGGSKAKQEAAGLTRAEAREAIDGVAEEAARLVREGRPVEEAVAEAVDGNLGKALDEIVDGKAKVAGEEAAQAIAAQGATGKTYFKDRRRTGAGTVEVTENDELVTTWQFESLEKLYKAAPENVAKPIRIIKEGDKVVGYEMEFVEGMSAREFIEKNGSLSEELRQKIRTAVDNLHQKGVAHGDLNPGNIIITPDGQIKFVDPFPYSEFRPEDIQGDLDRLAGWLNSDKIALPKEEIPQAITAARVAQEKTEEVVADVGGRLVGVPKIPQITQSNPVARAVQSVTDSAKGTYDSTIGRVFGRKGKEIGKEAGEQVARDVRGAVEEAVPVEVPQPVVIRQVNPEARERLIQDLADITTRETGEVVKDSVKNDLGQITPDNLDSLLQETKKRLKEERKQASQKIRSADSSQALNDLCMRSSASHALTCSVNSGEDFRAFKDRVEELARERRIGRGNSDLSYAKEFLDRQIEMKDLLTELFEIDTARRISIVKGESIYFEDALKKYPGLAKKISQTLNDFEKANAQLIKSLPRSEQERLAQKISELRQLLLQQNPDLLKEVLYDKIAVNYTDIILADFEVLNTDKLGVAVRNLQEAQGGGIFGLFKRAKPKAVGEDAKNVTTGVEDFVDNTLGQFTRRGEPEQAVRIQPVREPIAQRTITKLGKEVNEDAVMANHGEGFIGVFDGAGGHASGDVASRIARNIYESVLKELPENPSTREVLIALRTAHDRAIESMEAFARANPASRGMGTTATVVKVFEEEGERKAVILSMGDTRAYEVTKNGRVHQLTQDEGIFANDVTRGKVTPQRAQEIQKRLDEVTDVSQLSKEEAYYFENRNVVANTLTPDPNMPSVPRPDVFRLGENADYIFITSDGIHDNLTASQIEAIVRSARSPQEAVDNLVNAARETAGRQLNHRAKNDDLTAVAIDVSNRGRGNPQGIITSPAQALKNPERPVYVGAAQEQTRFGGIKMEINPSSVVDRKAYQRASEIAKKFIADPGHDEITAVAMAIERGLSESEISNAYKRVSEAIENLKARIKVTSYEIYEAEVVRHPNGNVEEILRPTGKKGERVEFNYFDFLNDSEAGRLMDDLIFEVGDVESVKRVSAAMSSLKQSEAGRAIDLDQLHRDIESSLGAPFFKAALARESTLKEAPPLIEQNKRAFEVLRDFCLKNSVATTLLSNCMRYFPDKIFEISNVHMVSPEALQRLCRRSGITGCYQSALEKIMVLRGQGKQTFIHECTHKYCALVATDTSGELGNLLRSRKKDIKPPAKQAATDSLYYYLTQNENKLIEGLTEYATQKAIRLLGEKAPGVAYPEAVNLIEKRVIPTIMKNSNRTREQAEAIVIEAAFGNYEKLFLEIGTGSKERGTEILTSILDEWVPRTPEELRGFQRLLAAMKVVAIGTAGVGGDVALDQATESLLDNYLNKPASEPENNSSSNPSKLLPFSGIKEVLAAGETTGQTGYFIDSDALEFTAKKEMAKNSLSERQSVTSEDLGQILKTDVIGSETFRVQGGYIVTTGKSGAGEGFIDPGKYIVEVGAIPGVDIKVPGIVDIEAGQEVIVPVAIREGSGKVEKIGFIREDGGAGKIYAQEKDKEAGKVTVVVFADKNNNGKFDKNEKILPWAGLTVELKKVNQEQMISLNEGDNSFTLPVLPSTPFTASLLLREITLQGGDAISVSTLENGAWKTYVAEGAKTYSFEDFPILSEKTYSIKSRRDSTFLLKGQEFVTPR